MHRINAPLPDSSSLETSRGISSDLLTLYVNQQPQQHVDLVTTASRVKVDQLLRKRQRQENEDVFSLEKDDLISSMENKKSWCKRSALTPTAPLEGSGLGVANYDTEDEDILLSSIQTPPLINSSLKEKTVSLSTATTPAAVFVAPATVATSSVGKMKEFRDEKEMKIVNPVIVVDDEVSSSSSSSSVMKKKKEISSSAASLTIPKFMKELLLMKSDEKIQQEEIIFAYDSPSSLQQNESSIDDSSNDLGHVNINNNNNATSNVCCMDNVSSGILPTQMDKNFSPANKSAFGMSNEKQLQQYIVIDDESSISKRNLLMKEVEELQKLLKEKERLLYSSNQ